MPRHQCFRSGGGHIDVLVVILFPRRYPLAFRETRQGVAGLWGDLPPPPNFEIVSRLQIATLRAPRFPTNGFRKAFC
jgi:hypothetical protein